MGDAEFWYSKGELAVIITVSTISDYSFDLKIAVEISRLELVLLYICSNSI